MDKARCTAVTALVHQEQNGYANLVLSAALEKQQLSARDKAFASALFYGVTERLITLDWCLEKSLSKPLKKLDAEVRAILHSGLYQAKYMQVPVAAAVNESVELCRGLKKSSAAGLVNAVLRKAVLQQPEQANYANKAQRLSVIYSVGRPVVDILLKQYPQQAETMLKAMFTAPQTYLRCNTLKINTEELCRQLEQEGVRACKGELPCSIAAELKGSPADTQAFQKGLFHVQGLASQLAALSLGAKPGQAVLDLCAAPGGKTLLLAQQMENKGTLISCDLAQNRLPLIQKSLERCGVTCAKVMHNDASVYQAELGTFDCVLADAPCSGLGIIAKKPDIRYKDMKNCRELHQLQLEILTTAARYVKKGGRLVYSTCTIDQRENQQVVTAFLQKHGEFKLVPAFTVPEGAVKENEMLTMLPGYCGSDGFFIATMERL